jgi:protein-L-isoaspartate(D-aspartate) O-methyltransferase
MGSIFKSEKDNRTMVMTQIRGRGITDPLVLKAFLETDRGHFVPEEMQHLAYNDHPLSIGAGQTISQPYIVAEMTRQLCLEGDEKVLEVGTGSGYQTAVLSRMAGQVYTIERIGRLAMAAREVLEGLGFDNIHYRVGDGYEGWPEYQPYDAIIVTAAPPEIPLGLISQLRIGGRMVLPVGERHQLQLLCRVTRKKDGASVEELEAVAFVPMIGGTE